MLQTRAVFKDTQVTAFINCGRCFHHLFHRSAATYFSLRRQLRPNWVTPKVAHRGKPVTETRSPRHVYYPPSQRVASCLGELTRPRPDVHPADTMITRYENTQPDPREFSAFESQQILEGSVMYPLISLHVSMLQHHVCVGASSGWKQRRITAAASGET